MSQWSQVSSSLLESLELTGLSSLKYMKLELQGIDQNLRLKLSYILEKLRLTQEEIIY